MLVLIIATVVVAGLIAYRVSKSKAKKQVAEETIVPIIEVQPKKELKLKERAKQEAKPKQKQQKPKKEVKSMEAKPASKEKKNKPQTKKTK